MKKLLFVFAMSLTFAASAKETPQPVGDTICVAEKNFPVLAYSNDKRCIEVQNRNGKYFYLPVGVKTDDKFEGSTIYYYKKCYYFYDGLKRAGYPNTVWLQKNKKK